MRIHSLARPGSILAAIVLAGAAVAPVVAVGPATPVAAADIATGVGAPAETAALQPLATNPNLIQQAYLKASNTDAGDTFGSAVAISGDTMVVGAPQEASPAKGVNGAQGGNSATYAGAAYVYVRTGTTWRQQAYLKASNTGAFDTFGSAVAISGNTIVIGARGEDSKATGVNGKQSDNSAAGAGAAYVFTRTGTTWRQQAYLKASNTNAGDAFGVDVAIFGGTIVVGADHEASAAKGVNHSQASNAAPNAGAAYVFTRTGTTWRQQAYLKASNTDAEDRFGQSVGIAGSTIVVGAPRESSAATGVNGNAADNAATRSGAAYVFTRTGSTWSQQAYLKASNTDAEDAFGWAVAVSGNTIIVGAPWERSNASGVNGDQADDSIDAAGAAYAFSRTGTTWHQEAYLKASNTKGDSFFGTSVAASGNAAIVGAEGEPSKSTGIDGDESDGSLVRSGAAYLLTRSGSTWGQAHYLKASNTDQTDYFATSVSISGTSIAVGADFESSAAKGVNGDQADNTAEWAGAAYAFVIDGTPPVTTAPAAVIRTGLVIPAGGVPIRLAWKGSDPHGSGIDHYEFAWWVGDQWIADPAPLTVARRDFDLMPGTPRRFRVRAVDRAGNVGAWATGPAITSALNDETWRGITYAGRWTSQASSWYWDGRTRYASKAGASASFSVTGRSVALMSTRAPTQGRYRVYVDGTLRGTVNLHAGAFTARVIVWQRSWSKSAKHTVKIVVEGTKGHPWVDLDAVIVLK